MRSTWHTLATAASLGIFTSWNAGLADDNYSQVFPATAALRAAAKNAESGNAAGANSEARRLSQELLRQAIIELDANQFESARRLTRRAAAIGATVGFVGVHPEQLLAEIERREHGAPVPTAQAAAESGRSYKARAIELLDRGLVALEEKRFDDAERFARQAAQLQVAWEKFDYRPENLLDEIRLQHPAGANGRDAGPTINSVSDVQPHMPAATDSSTEWRGGTRVPATSAEALLQQAMDDLRAGRDELARRRIEQALNAVPGAPQGAPLASFGGSYTAASSNRPIGISPSGIAPNGIAQSSPAPSVFFPVRRDQANVNPLLPAAANVAIKPMHDPYLGDEPTTTDKSSAGAQSMRESIPLAAPIDPAYLTRNSTPSMSDPSLEKVGYNAPATQPAPPSAAFSPRVQTSGDATLSPQIGWLEKNSAPIPGPPMGMPGNAPFPVPQRGFNPAPASPPVSNGQWPAGRMATPSGVDPAIANSPDQPKPSLFHRMWDAITGE